ncbi:unnamed protein product [Symbiodinium sp. CCMP2592]|nr:unnamed protein product [Symbiodinium sp. CCMP2592]
MMQALGGGEKVHQEYIQQTRASTDRNRSPVARQNSETRPGSDCVLAEPQLTIPVCVPSRILWGSALQIRRTGRISGILIASYPDSLRSRMEGWTGGTAEIAPIGSSCKPTLRPSSRTAQALPKSCEQVPSRVPCSETPASQLQTYEDLSRQQMMRSNAGSAERDFYERQASQLEQTRRPLEAKAAEAQREIDRRQRLIDIRKRVINEHAKVNAAKYRALNEKMYNDEQNRWPATDQTSQDPRQDPNYPRRTRGSHNFRAADAPSDADIDRTARDLDTMAKDDLKERKRQGKRGRSFGYQSTEVAKWAEAETEFGTVSLEGEFQYELGACEEGVCASVGAAVRVTVEDTVYEGDGVIITVKAETEVFGEASATAGCSRQVQGCAVTASASAGAKVRAETKVTQDLGYGVTADYTAAVEAGVVAKAEAEAGCTTKKGCAAKAKAYAGAYAKASADAQVGNEHVSGKVGGSVMVGAAAGGSGDVRGSYNDGSIKVGGEACGVLVVGVCASVEFEVDVSGAEDLAQDFGDFVAGVAGEGSAVANEALTAASQGIEHTIDHLGSGIQEAGRTAEKGWNEFTDEVESWNPLPKVSIRTPWLLQQDSEDSSTNTSTEAIPGVSEWWRLVTYVPRDTDEKPFAAAFDHFEQANVLTRRLLTETLPRIKVEQVTAAVPSEVSAEIDAMLEQLIS